MNDHIERLRTLGQSLWLDHFERKLLRDGRLARYIAEFSVSGLSAVSTDIEQVISDGDLYGEDIRRLSAAGLADEDLFYELALQDLREAAQLFEPVFKASQRRDGWVSLEVSPLLADNTAHTIRAASKLFERAARSNLMVKIPGTPEGLRAIEEVIVDGVPVNVTLLFSPGQYQAAAQAYMRGIERRLAAGLDPKVASVASVCVNGWDIAVKQEIADVLHDRLGIAMAMQSYRAHGELLASAPWQRLAAAGALPQRLLWTGTGTPDAAAPDTLYVQALAARGTINALPARTLLAFADHGEVGEAMPADGGYADALLEEFRREGVDDAALAERLQRNAVDAAAQAWHAMLSLLREQSAASAAANAARPMGVSGSGPKSAQRR